MVPSRTPSTHQLPRTYGRCFCNKIFLQKQSISPSRTVDGQYHSHFIHQQNGRVISSVSQSSVRDLAVVPSEKNISLCSAHSRHFKLCRRPGIQGGQRLVRLETRPNSFCLSQQSVGSPRDGLVCNPTHKSITKVCELETGPGGRSDGRFLSGLVSDKGLCIPPIQSSGSMSVPTEGAEYPATVSDNTGMGNSTLVPPATGNERRLSADVTNRPNDSQQGRVPTPPALPLVSRVTCLSQRNSSMRISIQARDLLVSAWRNQTSNSYESAWCLWCSWCCQQQIDPFSASIHHVVNFLVRPFAAGKEYRTINVYRSAISMTLPKIDGVNAGQHPLVCQVMKGIVQKKSPLPRYPASWDVSKALIYIKSLGSNESMSLKQLSEKLLLLLALTSAERGSELAAHDLRFKKYYPDGVEFKLPELTKSVRVGKNLKVSFHASFPQDNLLCPCECLWAYEARTTTSDLWILGSLTNYS